LTFEHPERPRAAAVYDDPATAVAGALLSKHRSRTANEPSDALRGDLREALGQTGTVVQDQTGADFQTHDRKTAAVGRYLIETDEAKSIRKLRQELLLNMVPFGAGEVSGLPHTDGANYERFRVFMSVIFRTSQQGIAQTLVSLAIAPNKKFESLDKVRFRMNDLTNTTNVAEQVDTHLTRCARFQSGEKTPKTEFYWVLDQSGSMRDDNQKVADFASQFVEQVKNTSLDYRLGVTNMDRRNHGHLRVPPGWHTDGATFRKEVEEAVIGCRQGGSWRCNGGLEHGLAAAKRGIAYMTGQASEPPSPTEQIRSGAQVVTIFMSDEEANSIKRRNRRIQHFTNHFQNRTTAFAIVAEGYNAGCPSEDGKAYKEVALATGGKIASLCAEDLTQTIRDIIFAATGLSSNYSLPQTPISSSLRVYLNGTWVPRNRQNGFEYFAENNAIAFFGSYRPTPQDQNDEGPDDFVAVTYETFKDRCKNAASNKCRTDSGE
ncbi:MAG: vWA domain-containing protein, partial [Bradymonadaceae bacterium]